MVLGVLKLAVKPKLPCNFPGCPELIDDGGYCDKHRLLVVKYYDKERDSSNKRGYTAHWRKVRAMKLRRNPLCERCEARGKLKEARIVHHIVPIARGGAIHDMDNLMSVCRSCHDVLHSVNGEGQGGVK